MKKDLRPSGIRTLCVAVCLALFATASHAGEIPASLRDLVLAARQRPILDTRLQDVPFRGLAPFSPVPYLLWPAQDVHVPHDPAAAGDWIRRSRAELGHGDFEPSFVGTSTWRGNEVWSYELVRRGIALHDARVRLHFRDRRFVGLVNAVPLPILSVEEPPEPIGPVPETVYVPRRQAGGYALRLARVLREIEGDHLRISLILGGETVRRIVEPLATMVAPAATIAEWQVPVGTFPDQIDIDSSGLVWFSQPSNNLVTSFDPATEMFTQHATTGGTSPDGLMVDGSDVLWTGLYDGGGLGKLVIATSTFTAIPVPYSPAAAAIPNEMASGTLWLTDHLNNRISEYDPASGTWLASLVLPTPGCWVVGGVEDPASHDVYFTEYQADQLGRKISGGPFVDIDVAPGSGPAFAVVWGGVVYFSEWNQARLGAYEIASGDLTEYAFPVPGENGGPIDVTPGGLIAVGTRNQGYIMVFDPADSSFDAHAIPTPASGLKDGLRSDANGTIWFTESGANKIARLTLGPEPPVAQFSGAPLSGPAPLTVQFTDLSSSSPTSWSWSFGDTGTSSLPSPSHEYTSPGDYPVSLTVGNDFGSDSETKLDYVHVSVPCPLASDDVLILGQRVGADIVFSWSANPDCKWAVHRATAAEGLFDTPPVMTVTLPTYRDHAPPEPLVFYGVVPKHK